MRIEDHSSSSHDPWRPVDGPVDIPIHRRMLWTNRYCIFEYYSSLHVSVLSTVVGHLSSRKLSPLELFSRHYMPL